MTTTIDVRALPDADLRAAVAAAIDAGTITEETPELLEMLARARERRDDRDALHADEA